MWHIIYEIYGNATAHTKNKRFNYEFNEFNESNEISSISLAKLWKALGKYCVWRAFVTRTLDLVYTLFSKTTDTAHIAMALKLDAIWNYGIFVRKVLRFKFGFK